MVHTERRLTRFVCCFRNRAAQLKCRMHLREELRPLVHLDPHLRDAALLLLKERNSDLIFVSDFGLRLVHQAMRSQIYLTDRYPRPSSYSGLGYTDLVDCIESILASGYYLVRCRPFRFNSDTWLGFLEHHRQVESPKVQESYTSPLIPLLKIANLPLHGRLSCGLRSISNASCKSVV